ncbi:hypothetical protein PYW07_009517 [Mythimna separata]|uniref:Uncharacterized protein n=1 Tax=Mythimna separata TaxID=271217 RepID=A0AAD8DN95_MYTSE|nr:hypothetical protein PYW07_009517 [Mythimna separata]
MSSLDRLNQIDKMKSLVLVVLLAVAATAAVVGNEEPDVVMVPDVVEDSELAGVTDRRNLNVGNTSNSVRIFNQQVRANGIANRVLTRNVQVRAPSGRRIAAIRVNRIGASQNARPTIASGGIGNTQVTIRITSARGRGYNYRIEVFAR